MQFICIVLSTLNETLGGAKMSKMPTCKFMIYFEVFDIYFNSELYWKLVETPNKADAIKFWEDLDAHPQMKGITTIIFSILKMFL